MAARTAVLLLFVGIGACGGGASAPPASSPSPASPPAPASSPSLEAMLASDMTAHRGLPWSAGRHLTWRDFQGAAPQEGDEAAKTAYGIYYGWKCQGREFEFLVIAAFHADQSWVKTVVLSDSAESRRVLAHEQTHFNIVELYARRMRRRFAGFSQPCRMSDDQLSAEARRILDDERVMQRRYDAETGHGLERREQAAWEADIRRQLGLN